MSKDEMIRKLVAHSVKTALSETKPYWLSELFEKGFAGYRNLSRGQLIAELQMRGLSDEPDEDDDDSFDDDLDMDVAFGLDLDRDVTFDLPARAGHMD